MNTNSVNSISPLQVGLIVLTMAFLSPVTIVLTFDHLNFPIPNLQVFGVWWELRYMVQSGLSLGFSPFVLPLSEIGVLGNLEYWNDPLYLDGLIWQLLVTILPVFLITTRLIFVNHMVNRYQGNSTRKRTWILGILCESFFLVGGIISTLSLILTPIDWLFLNIPLPLTLLIGLAVLKYRPVSESAIPWKELDEPEK